MKKPLLRFAYKNIVMPEPPGTSARTSSSKFPISSVRAVFANPSIDSEIFNGANITPEVTSSISRILSDESSGFFVFTCPTYLEIKLNDKIGPYKQMDQPPPSDRMLFSLLHSDISPFLNRIKELQFIIFLRNCEGKLKAEQALSSIVNKQSTIVFDTSKLLDFHENLLLKQPMLVKNVKPLVLHPGAIMITDKRVYFQPAQLNNIGDSFHVFDINKIARMYKRRYMLRQTGLEIVMKVL
jgi:factor associated with neutral sphingomyelinase activation